MQLFLLCLQNWLFLGKSAHGVGSNRDIRVWTTWSSTCEVDYLPPSPRAPLVLDTHMAHSYANMNDSYTCATPGSSWTVKSLQLIQGIATVADLDGKSILEIPGWNGKNCFFMLGMFQKHRQKQRCHYLIFSHSSHGFSTQCSSLFANHQMQNCLSWGVIAKAMCSSTSS